MNNVENPRITEWTSTNVERSLRLPHVYTKMMYGKLGGIACRKNIWSNDLLDSRAEAVLPFWSGIFATGLWAIWGDATGRSALQISSSPLPACTASLLASHLYTATLLRALQLPGRTNPNAMALSSFPGPCRHEPLPERNVRRMLVYLSISLSICLSIYLSICLSVYLTS